MNVAVTLRQARTRAGLSQAELAKKAGTSQPALARYETGVALPTIPTLERLLSGCGQRLELRSSDANERTASVSSMRGQLGPLAQHLRRRRSRLLDSARAHGVRKVRVFGSIARSEASPASDVDLLVELAPGRTLLDLAGFRVDAVEILGIPVDVATPDMLKERIRTEVLAEAVPL
jgi:predicted nucleotidyltransferase/DNA-binding XRE family transcriptional regulator